MDALSSNSAPTNIPVGTDMTMEYESDLGDSDLGDETDDPGKARHKIRGNRAHVIQKHAWGKAGCVPMSPFSSNFVEGTSFEST